MLDWVDMLRTIINPSEIYSSAFKWSFFIMPVSGIMLAVCCYVRVMEQQLTGSGIGGWGATLKSIAGWSLVLGLYGAMAALIVAFINEIYKYMNSFGSIEAMMMDLKKMTEIVKQKAANNPDNESIFSFEYWKHLGAQVSSIPGYFITLASYEVSKLSVLIVTGSFRVMHAVLFSGTYMLGLLLIPLAVSKQMNLNAGWIKAVKFVFLWPVVESLILGFFSLPMRSLIKDYLQSSDSFAVFDHINLLVVFSVINGITIILLIASLILTVSIINHAIPAQAMMTPVIEIIKKMHSFRR